MSKKLRDLSGLSFGRWSVQGRAPNRANRTMWHCTCACGNPREVAATHLVSGASMSCGCITKRHGQSKTDEFKSWEKLRRRCRAKSGNAAKNYSLRGITVCDRWGDFSNFIADMGPKPSPQHSIDRIDNDRGYSPENCRWATPAEQALNRRSNVLLTINGETLSVTEWAKRTGISRHTVYSRLYKGHAVDASLLEPSRQVRFG